MTPSSRTSILTMRNLLRFLSPSERQVLRTLSLLLVLSLVLFNFVSMRERRTYFERRDSFQARQKEIARLNTSHAEKKQEWERWRQAVLDLAELKANFFYDDAQGINQFRLDMQQVFDEAGVSVTGINYTYSEFAKEGIKKVSAAFHLTGSYLNIKKFIDLVERFPRFLTLERVDFVRIDTANDSIDLNVVLAGYYE